MGKRAKVNKTVRILRNRGFQMLERQKIHTEEADKKRSVETKCDGVCLDRHGSQEENTNSGG